jgi:hypothetical protein
VATQVALGRNLGDLGSVSVREQHTTQTRLCEFQLDLVVVTIRFEDFTEKEVPWEDTQFGKNGFKTFFDHDTIPLNGIERAAVRGSCGN